MQRGILETPPSWRQFCLSDSQMKIAGWKPALQDHRARLGIGADDSTR